MKCIVCSQKKGNRFCAALNNNICSLRCGTRRQKEIECALECEYLKKGNAYQLARQVNKEVDENFNIESEDLFRVHEEVIPSAFNLFYQQSPSRGGARGGF